MDRVRLNYRSLAYGRFLTIREILVEILWSINYPEYCDTVKRNSRSVYLFLPIPIPKTRAREIYFPLPQLERGDYIYRTNRWLKDLNSSEDQPGVDIDRLLKISMTIFRWHLCSLPWPIDRSSMAVCLFFLDPNYKVFAYDNRRPYKMGQTATIANEAHSPSSTNSWRSTPSQIIKITAVARST